jgi:exosome complex RNA-binding protein Csl4
MDEPTYGTYLLLRQKLGVIVARVSRTRGALLMAGRT